MTNTSKLVIVDDDASMRDALSALARSIGMAVTTYASADECVADGGHARADCIVTDVQMPGMSGIDMLELMRSQQLDTPAIVMSAYPSAALRARTTAAGNASFLGKPFDGNDMVARIEQALDGQQR